MSESHLTVIKPEFIDAFWPDVKPLLARAIEYADGDYSLFDIYNRLKNDPLVDLWVSVKDGKIEVACVGWVVQYPGKLCYGVPFIGGSGLTGWLKFQDNIADHARDLGCDELEGYARDGWLRVLTGWKKRYTLIRKRL